LCKETAGNCKALQTGYSISEAFCKPEPTDYEVIMVMNSVLLTFVAALFVKVLEKISDSTTNEPSSISHVVKYISGKGNCAI
jgi:hypothetical protein